MVIKHRKQDEFFKLLTSCQFLSLDYTGNVISGNCFLCVILSCDFFFLYRQDQLSLHLRQGTNERLNKTFYSCLAKQFNNFLGLHTWSWVTQRWLGQGKFHIACMYMLMVTHNLKNNTSLELLANLVISSVGQSFLCLFSALLALGRNLVTF